MILIARDGAERSDEMKWSKGKEKEGETWRIGGQSDGERVDERRKKKEGGLMKKMMKMLGNVCKSIEVMYKDRKFERERMKVIEERQVPLLRLNQHHLGNDAPTYFNVFNEKIFEYPVYPEIPTMNFNDFDFEESDEEDIGNVQHEVGQGSGSRQGGETQEKGREEDEGEDGSDDDDDGG